MKYGRYEVSHGAWINFQKTHCSVAGEEFSVTLPTEVAKLWLRKVLESREEDIECLKASRKEVTV